MGDDAEFDAILEDLAQREGKYPRPESPADHTIRLRGKAILDAVYERLDAGDEEAVAAVERLLGLA